MPNSIGEWQTTAKALKPARAEKWRQVFGSDVVPITCPIPLSIGSFPGVDGAKYFYLLDLKAISPEQRERLIASIALEFKLSIDDVRANLDQMGCPILADDVITSSIDSGLFHSLIDDGRLNDNDWYLEEDSDGYFDDDEDCDDWIM